MKWPRLRSFQKKTVSSGKIRLTQDDIQAIRTRQIHPRTPEDMPFRNAVASELSLSAASWDGENFTGCDLRGADLSSCTFSGSDFCDADLWNADLRDSDSLAAFPMRPKISR